MNLNYEVYRLRIQYELEMYRIIGTKHCDESSPAFQAYKKAMF